MEARYRGTVVEELLPLIGKDTASALKRHGVRKEQYALWLYRRASNATGIHTAMVIVLCVLLLTGLVTTLGQNGGVALNGQTMFVVLAMAGLFALILALTAWTMRHTSEILKQYMQSESFLHKTTVDYVMRVPKSVWKHIALFEPDLDRFRLHRAVHRKAPALTIAQQRRIAVLRPLRTLAGWVSLGTLALLFFVGESSLNIISALVVTSVGVWLTLCAMHVALAGQIVDARTGLVTFGKPARLIGAFATACSMALVVVGIAGILTMS